MDYTVHGILQARKLEWVAFPFSRGSSQSRDWTQISHMQADSLSVEPQGKPLENSKDCTRKLVELINELSKIAGHKINVQKSVTLLYTNNELSEREIKMIISLTIESRRIGYLKQI